MKVWYEHTHVTIPTSRQQILPALQQLLTYPLPVNMPPKWLLLSLLSPQICYSYFDLHVNGITEYVLFRDWLLWLNIMFLKFIHIFALRWGIPWDVFYNPFSWWCKAWLLLSLGFYEHSWICVGVQMYYITSIFQIYNY